MSTSTTTSLSQEIANLEVEALALTEDLKLVLSKLGHCYWGEDENSPLFRLMPETDKVLSYIELSLREKIEEIRAAK